MPTNDFKEFCPTDTGTNLLTVGDYTVDADRVSGQKPGIAASALNNRALRQANFITSQLAQLLANVQGVDVLDDANTTKLVSQFAGLLLPLNPIQSTYSAGSGSHNLHYVFFCAAANATVGATYTNNAVTFTVVYTIAAGTILVCTASGAPAVSGTLTKSAGTGDSSITFYTYRKPSFLECELMGAGGGGCGSASAGVGGTGGTGGDTTFGTSLFTGSGGVGGVWSVGGGQGGAASIGAGGGGRAFQGGNGQGPLAALSGGSGGAGGTNPMCSQPGQPLAAGGASTAGAPGGRGCGGGGASGYVPTGTFPGVGGGAGGYVKGYVYSPTGAYAYAVGAASAGGVAGTNGAAGGTGGAGLIIVTEHYQ